MKPRCPMSTLYEFAACLETEKSSPRPLVLVLNIHFNIILQSIPTSSKRFFFHRTSSQHFICLSLTPMLPPFHIPWFDDPNNIWRGAQIMKILLLHFLNCPFTFFLLGSNIFPSIPFSKITSIYSSIDVRGLVTYPYKTTSRIVLSCI